jgi:hypothetical protein
VVSVSACATKLVASDKITGQCKTGVLARSVAVASGQGDSIASYLDLWQVLSRWKTRDTMNAGV